MEPVEYISKNLGNGKRRIFKGISISKDITGRITTIKNGTETYKIVRLGGK